jgi:hypothetical protein
MNPQDSTHWLWRLDALGWLAAAQVELDHARAQLGSRRTAVTHARRSAGMALNGVLVAMSTRGWPREHAEQVWGRSYIDHLRTVADAGAREPLDAQLGQRCRALLEIPPMQPTGLVKLQRSRDEAAGRALDLATEIVAGCEKIVAGETTC